MTKWRGAVIVVVGLLFAADSPEDAVKKEKGIRGKGIRAGFGDLAKAPG